MMNGHRFWLDRFFWLAFMLSLSFYAGCFAILWAIHIYRPTTPPFVLMAYGDADFEGLSVSTVSGDSGSLYRDTQDRPGGEVLPGILSQVPETLVQATNPFSSPLVMEVETTPAVAEQPREPLLPAPVAREPLPEIKALPPAAVPRGEAHLTAAAPVAPGSARGLRAPQGVGTDPNELPGLGKARGAQGSSRMAAGTPSAGGRVGATTGVSMLGNPKPSYPSEARRAGMEGTVLVWLRVSAEGKVVEAQVQRSSGYTRLDQAAVQFAYTIRLQPARRGSTAVEGEATLPVVYRLVD